MSLVLTHTKKICPFCRKKIRLGNCPIVATNVRSGYDTYDPDPDAFAAVPEPRPYTGARVLGLAGEYPVVAAPPLDPERNAPAGHREPGLRPWLARTGRRAVPRFVWRTLPRPLEPVTARASTQDVPARSCYRCGQPLPPALDTRRIVTVAVVGSTTAGKTHYLTSLLLQAARDQELSDAGFEEFALDEDSERRYQDDYYGPVFQQRKQMEPTNPGEGPVRLRPLVCEVTFEGADPVALLFHDIPGEVLLDRQQRAAEADFVGLADGMIFLVDPEQLDRADWRRGERSGLETAQTHPQAGLLRACLGDMARNGRTQTPVAVTISKSDLLSGLLPRTEFGFSRPAPTDDPVKWDTDLAETGQDVVRALRLLNARDLLATARSLDPGRLSFHAVAAIGSTPVNEKIVTLEPLRCLDPLWVLLRRIPGIIPGTDR
ncbi:hypothetical protein OG607_44095 [Streptomyces sp. NBC_01537]|uniref:TRAFAC clade GTPase domain-containing protein n=1 Tax=Streptomyces sp. NBC_01537 TaxID=2903896 RepID=UPI0038641D88